MDIFVQLLRGSVRAGGPEAALAAIEAVAREASRDPERARGALQRIGRTHHDHFGIGSDLHDVYRAAFEALQRRVPIPSHDVCVVRCTALAPVPSVRAVQRSVRRGTEPFVLVRCEERADLASAAGELTALALLCEDPRVGMVVVGERDALFRRALLVAALLPDRALAAGDVADALGDVVRRAGSTVRVVGP